MKVIKMVINNNFKKNINLNLINSLQILEFEKQNRKKKNNFYKENKNEKRYLYRRLY